jgi:hypothetical protein
MYGIGNDPWAGQQWDQQGQGNGLGPDYGSAFVDRVMSAEYNLAIQRHDPVQAMDIAARLVGFLFSRRGQ